MSLTKQVRKSVSWAARQNQVRHQAVLMLLGQSQAPRKRDREHPREAAEQTRTAIYFASSEHPKWFWNGVGEPPSGSRK